MKTAELLGSLVCAVCLSSFTSGGQAASPLGADVRVQMKPANMEAYAGDTVVCLAVVKNHGPRIANNVWAWTHASDHFDWITITTATGSSMGGIEIPSLAPGKEVELLLSTPICCFPPGEVPLGWITIEVLQESPIDPRPENNSDSTYVLISNPEVID